MCTIVGEEVSAVPCAIPIGCGVAPGDGLADLGCAGPAEGGLLDDSMLAVFCMHDPEWRHFPVGSLGEDEA